MKLIEDIQAAVIPTLLANPNVCRLVGDISASALLSSSPPRPNTLKDHNVFDYKHVPNKQEDKANYITLDFIGEFVPYTSRITVAIYLFVHQDLIRLIDGRNRLTALSTEVTNTLQQKVHKGTLPGIGRWNLVGLSGTNLSDYHPGICLLYEVTDIREAETAPQ